MKKIIYGVIVLALVLGGAWWWTQNGHRIIPAPVTENWDDSQELCYTKIEKSQDSNFEDKYKLVLNVLGEKAWGELKLMPADKDALVGKFEGTITKLGTADLWWNAEGEGHTSLQELTIHFNQNSAEIGLGAMKDRGDGAYIYENPAVVDYALSLPTISCEEFYERETVEKYLWVNIGKLSPIAPALGGNWYVVAAALDLEKNSGTVTYEDGHIQEKRNFTYVLKADGSVESLTIE